MNCTAFVATHGIPQACTWHASCDHGLQLSAIRSTEDPSMPVSPDTLESLYCAAHKCQPGYFRRQAFWHCLYWHTIPFFPFLKIVKRGYFIPDQELVSAIGSASTMAQVWDEIRHYFSDPKNQGWLRKRANFRISGQKVIEFSRKYLPPMPKPLITER